MNRTLYFSKLRKTTTINQTPTPSYLTNPVGGGIFLTNKQIEKNQNIIISQYA